MLSSKYLAVYKGIEARTGACRTKQAKYIAGEKSSDGKTKTIRKAKKSNSWLLT